MCHRFEPCLCSYQASWPKRLRHRAFNSESRGSSPLDAILRRRWHHKTWYLIARAGEHYRTVRENVSEDSAIQVTATHVKNCRVARGALHPGAAWSPYLVSVYKECISSSEGEKNCALDQETKNLKLKNTIRQLINILNINFKIWNRSDWPRKPFAKRSA
jgi:hypothetical protein